MTEVLQALDLDRLLSKIVTAALHRVVPLESLADLTLDDRLAIAEQVEQYGATGAEDRDGASLGTGEDGMMTSASALSLQHELCAEVYALDTPENRRRLPIVAGIGALMDAVLQRGSPIAEKVNRDLHRSLAVETYLGRTRPEAVRQLQRAAAAAGDDEVGRSRAALLADADFAWELANPQEPPTWMLDELEAASGADRDASRRLLMEAPWDALVRRCDPTDPDRPCATSAPGASVCAWHLALWDVARRRSWSLSPAVANAVLPEIEAVVDEICADLIARPLPDLGEPLFRATYWGGIGYRLVGRSGDELVEYLDQCRTSADLACLARLPPEWSSADREALRQGLRDFFARKHDRVKARPPITLGKAGDRAGSPLRATAPGQAARSARRVQRDGAVTPSGRRDAQAEQGSVPAVPDAGAARTAARRTSTTTSARDSTAPNRSGGIGR